MPTTTAEILRTPRDSAELRDSPSETIADLAEVLARDRWLLCHGDALDLIEQVPDRSVDLIVTSPPYWGQRTYGLDHNWDILEAWQDAGGSQETIPSYSWYAGNGGVLGLEPIPDWFVSHLVEFFDRAWPKLKDHGNVWVNLGDTYFARWSSIRENGRQGLGENTRVRRRTPMGSYRQEKQLLLIPSRFAIAMQAKRWIVRNDVIWHKPNVPPRPEKDRLRLAHEHFFHFVKRPTEGRARYFYDLTAAEPEAMDVVSYNVRPSDRGHSATFPPDVVRPRILSSCPIDGVVLDPFCGTGTSLKVAIDNGRRAIGFDTGKEYLSVAAASLAQQALFDGRA